MPCKLKTLGLASAYAYQNQSKPTNETKLLERELDTLGYTVLGGRDSGNKVFSKNRKFYVGMLEAMGFKSKIGFVILKPKDEKDPYIFSFRGTNLGKNNIGSDLKADIKLTQSGVAFEEYRDEAFAAFRWFRAQHRHEKIVLTGHSLGGNLACDVASRSSYEWKDEELIHVRTFNSAGHFSEQHVGMLSSPHRSRLVLNEQASLDTERNMNKHNQLLAPNIIHYRLYNDLVGKFKNLGQKVTFIGSQGQRMGSAHSISSVLSDLPEELGDITIAGEDPLNPLRESILGFESSYQCKKKADYGTATGLRSSDKIVLGVADYKLEAMHELTHGHGNLLPNDQFVQKINNVKKETLALGSEIRKNYPSADIPAEIEIISKRCTAVLMGIGSAEMKEMKRKEMPGTEEGEQSNNSNRIFSRSGKESEENQKHMQTKPKI